MTPTRFPAGQAGRLLDGERRAGLDPVAVVAEVGVAPKETVLEVGAGNGFFTLVLAQAVGPEGRVIAADVSPGMLAELRQRAEEAGLTNLRYVPSEEQVVPLADAAVDKAFLVDVLHEAEDPARLLKETVRVVRRGGEVVVVDWEAGEGPPGPPAGERLGSGRTRDLLGQAGLAAGRPLEAVPSPHFGFWALKPEEGPGEEGER